MIDTSSSKRRFVSVGTKLAGASMALVLLVTAAVYVALSRHEREGLLHAKEVAAHAVTRLFAATAASAVVFSDESAVSDVLDVLVRGEDVTFAAVWAVNGNAIGPQLGERRQEGLPVVPAHVPSSVELERFQDHVVVWAPIRSREDAVVGVAGIAFSLARENAAIATIERRTLLVSASIALGLVLVLAWVSRRAIVRPLAVLVGYAEKLEQGDSSELGFQSNDEIGVLASAFRSMTHAIRSREERIRARNADMQLVLDNVQQGFMTLDRRGVMAEECSRIVATWFGPASAGTTFAAYLSSVDANAAALFELGWDTILEDMLPLDIVISQLPRSARKGEQTFELAYRPIMEGEVLAKLIVVITDATERVARGRAEQAQREMLAVFRRVLGDRPAFEQFFTEASALVAGIESSDGTDDGLLRRQIHTLKGNAAIFGLESLAAFCHEVEDGLVEGERATLDAASRKELRRRWTEVADLRGQLLGDDRVAVDRAEYQAFVDGLRKRGVAADLVATAASWAFEPAARRLALLAEQTVQLAKRLGKAELITTAMAKDIHLPPRRWAPFWSAFAHVVRNVVDHGVETTEERAAAGKSVRASVAYVLERTPRSVVLSVTDNGRGIDWSAVAAKASARGLPCATSGDLEEALFADGLSTSDTASVTSGRGVGLGAVRAVVRELGGEIAVYSVRGRGTELRFTFPLAMLDEEEATHEHGGLTRGAA